MRIATVVPALAAVILGALAAAPALAESIPPGVGADDRPRPEYDPVGIRSGGLFIYPSVEGGAMVDDNVFATANGKVSDVAFGITPSVKVQSDWGRHSLRALAEASSWHFAKQSTEDHTDLRGLLGGYVDVTGRTRVKAQIDATRLAESRRSIDLAGNADEPINMTAINYMVGVEQRLNRLKFDARFKQGDIEYSSARLRGGGVQRQDFRDYRIRTASLRTTYEFSPGYRALVVASREWRDYDIQPGDPGYTGPSNLVRDSRGWRAEGGVEVELTSILYGEVRVGYLSHNYKSPALKDVSGLSYAADLLWNPTTLTSVRLGGERRMEETASATAAGRVVSSLDVEVDHELLRNLVLSAGAGRARHDYKGTRPSETYWQGRLGARYILNQRLSATADYSYDKRTSANALNRFASNRLGVAVRLSW